MGKIVIMFSKLILICVVISWSRCEEQKKYAISFASVNIQKNLDNEGQPVINSTDEDESYNYINYHVYTPPRKQPVLNYHPESVEKFNRTFVDHLDQLNNQLDNQHSKHEDSEQNFKVNTNNQVYYKAPQGRHTDIDFRNIEENYSEQKQQNRPRKQNQSSKTVKYTNVDNYNKYTQNGEYLPEETQQNKNKQSSRIKEQKFYREETSQAESKNNFEEYKTKTNNYGKQLHEQEEVLKGGNTFINPLHDTYNKEKYEGDATYTFPEEKPKNKKRMNIKYGENYNENTHDVYYKPKIEKQAIRQDKHQHQEYYSTTSKPDNFHVNEQQFNNEQDVHYRQNNDKKVVHKKNMHNKYLDENVYFKPKTNNNDTGITRQSEKIKVPSKYEDYSQKELEFDVYSTPKTIKQTDNKQYYVASTAKYIDDYYHKDRDQPRDNKISIKQPDNQQYYKDYQQPLDFNKNELKQTEGKQQFYVVSTPKYLDEYQHNEKLVKQSVPHPQQYLTSTVRYSDVYTAYEQLLSTVYKPNPEQFANDQTYKVKENKPLKMQPEKHPSYSSSTTKYAEDGFSKTQNIKQGSPSTIRYTDVDLGNEQHSATKPKKEYNPYEQQQYNTVNQDSYRRQPEKKIYLSTPKYVDDYFGNEQRSTSPKYNDYNNGYEQPTEVKNVHKLKIFKEVIDRQPEKQQVYLASSPKYNDDYFAELKNVHNKTRLDKETQTPVKQLDIKPIILSSTPRYQIHLVPKYNDEYSNNEHPILPKYNTSHVVEEQKIVYRPKINKEPSFRQADKQYSPSPQTPQYYGNDQHSVPYEDSYNKPKNVAEQTTKRHQLSSTTNYNDNYYANEHLTTNVKVNDDYSTYDLQSDSIFSKAKKNKEHHGRQEEKKKTIKYTDDHFGNEQRVTKLKPISHDTFQTYEQPDVSSVDKIKQIKEAPTRPVHKTPVYLTVTGKYNENYFANEQHSTTSPDINSNNDYVYNGTPKRHNKENDNYLGNDQYVNNQDDVFYKPTQNFRESYKPNKIKQEFYSTQSPVLLNNTQHDNQHAQEFANVYYKPEKNIIKQVNKPSNNQHYSYNKQNDNKQHVYKFSEDYQPKQPTDEGNIYYKQSKVKIINYDDDVNTNNTYNVHKEESVYFKPTKQTRPVQKYTPQVQEEFQQIPFNKHQYSLTPSKTIDNYKIPDQVQQDAYRKLPLNKPIVENQPSRDNGYDYKYGNQNEEYAYKAADNFNERVYPSAKSFTFQTEQKNDKHLNDYKTTPFTHNEKDKQQTDRDKFYSDIDDSFFQ